MLYLEAVEEEKYLSYNSEGVTLHSGYPSQGEVFVVKYGLDPRGPVTLDCIGEEQGKYLSHAKRICTDQSESEVWLQYGYQGEGEGWILHRIGDGKVAFECNGEERGNYLSCVSGKVKLEPTPLSESSLWRSYDVDYLTDQQFKAQTSAWQTLEGAL